MADSLHVRKTSKFSTLAFLSEAMAEVAAPAPAPSCAAPVIPTAPAPIDDKAAVDEVQSILSALAKDGKIDDSWVFAQQLGVDHQQLVGAIKSLSADRYVVEEPLSTVYWTLTSEGKTVAAEGSPEVQLMRAVGPDGASIAALNQALGEVAKIGMGVCMKNKWLQKVGDKVVALVDAAAVRDDSAAQLRAVEQGEQIAEEDLKNLKKRKLVTQVTRKSARIVKGADFCERRVRKVAELHRSMLDAAAEGHWTNLSFKAVNLRAMGSALGGGSFHPLLKVRAEFRRILMDLGFSEMPSNKWIESSFWNFDALFQPQSHPARDAHDTFFIKSPARTAHVPADYYETVKRTHESGGYGSIGYQYTFKEEEARKNLLRTHTTAISAQMLYQLAQDMQSNGGVFEPKKYFSIDRVFRNEAMDATHLCEFHQVEGLVADRNLTLGHLIGTIRAFFHKIGITELRFKPAYNPYTEPSMEIFGYHPDLKKWTEIGNSGMFRPEMLRPMGLPEDVRVIAWGLSLERPTMIKYRIENIRDLFGHKADLNKQRHAPIARF